MWILTILLQGEASPTTLQFKDQQGAQAAYDATFRPQHAKDWMPSATVTVVDHFGRTLTFTWSLLAKALLQSLERSMEGDRQVNLMATVSNAMLQAEALDHPKIKELQRKQQALQQAAQAVVPFAGMSPARFG